MRGFSDGDLAVLDVEQPGFSSGVESDLEGAVRRAARMAGERASALVVVSDGRLSTPGGEPSAEPLVASLGSGVPIHTVRVTDEAPADVALRSVRAAGAAVAHQPLAITVEVSCSGGVACDEVPVRLRELRRQAPANELARG